MKFPPDTDSTAMFGLFCALLVSLEKRGALKQSEFIADLAATIESSKNSRSLPPSTLSELSRLLSWFQDHGHGIRGS